MKSWKYVIIAAMLPASLWAGRISGQVRLNNINGIGVAGVQVVVTAGATNAARLDSAVSDSAGNYLILNANILATAHTIIASKSGYNTSAVLLTPALATDTGRVAFNPIVTINNRTSVITGLVRRASDSTPLSNATVTISGCGIDPPVSRTAQTDSLGVYRVDSVNTGVTPPGCTVTASATNYLAASTGNVASTWNTTTTVPTFFLTQSLGTLRGEVRSTSAGTPVIPNAKVVVSTGGVKVDSAVTNAAGQFTLTLNAATYSVDVSALPGFKDSLGRSSKIVSATVTFANTTNIIVNLVQATATISGTVRVGSTNTASPVLEGARVLLQRRQTNGGGGQFITLDSTFTDINGIYVFSNLILASGTNGENYRLVIGKVGPLTYGISATNANPVTTGNLVVTLGGTLTGNYAVQLYTVIAILPNLKGESAIRFTTLGENLILDLGASNAVRTVSVFNLDGALQHQVSVAAGESHATIPATFSKGFLIQIK